MRGVRRVQKVVEKVLDPDQMPVGRDPIQSTWNVIAESFSFISRKSIDVSRKICRRHTTPFRGVPMHSLLA